MLCIIHHSISPKKNLALQVTSFVKCFPEKSVDFVISDKFEQFRFNDTHKFRRHTAYLFHTAAYAWTIRNAVSPNRRYDPCCNFLKFWHLFVPGVSVR